MYVCILFFALKGVLAFVVMFMLRFMFFSYTCTCISRLVYILFVFRSIIFASIHSHVIVILHTCICIHTSVVFVCSFLSFFDCLFVCLFVCLLLGCMFLFALLFTRALVGSGSPVLGHASCATQAAA